MATLVVHVVPRARKTEVAGRHGDAIKIKIAAAPVDGAANAELTRFLAERLGVPSSMVRLVGGATARRKTIAVDGLAADAVTRKLLQETT